MSEREVDGSVLRPEDELWLRHRALEMERLTDRTESPTPQEREVWRKAAVYPVTVARADTVGLYARQEELADRVQLDVLDLVRLMVLDYPVWWLGHSTERRAAAAVMAVRLDLLGMAVRVVETEVERYRRGFEETEEIDPGTAPLADVDELLARLTTWPPRVGLSVTPPRREDEAHVRLQRATAQDVQEARPLLEALLPGDELSVWEREALLVHAGRWALQEAVRPPLEEVLRRHLERLRRVDKPRWDPERGWLPPGDGESAGE